MCPDREFSSKIYQNTIFFGKNREFSKFAIFVCINLLVMLKYTSCPNFVKKYSYFFEEVTSFSVFTNLQGHWPGFTRILVDTFQKKAVTYKRTSWMCAHSGHICSMNNPLTWTNQSQRICLLERHKLVQNYRLR